MRLGVLVVTASIAAAAPAAAAPSARDSTTFGAPDATQLAEVRANVGPHVARVTCAAGAFVLPEVRMDSTGIWSASAAPYHSGRPALIVAGDVPAPKLPPRPIAWATVDSIEVGRSQWRKGAAFGAIVGLVFYGFTYGITQSIAEGASTSGESASAIWLGTCVGVATAGGAALMAPTKHWRTAFRRGD